MSKNKKNGGLSLPEGLINQINEFSTGGFILFIKNVNGDISTIEKYDTSVDAIGLRKYVNIWGNVADSVGENAIAANLLGVDPEDLNDFGDDD